MKSKTRALLVLMVIGIAIPFSFNHDPKFNSEDGTELISLKSSGAYIESFIHIDGSIANNWSDTLAEPWCYLDNGVYVIENVTIDANDSPTGSGILINNSQNVKFVIQNCTIFNADHFFFDSGIWLENTNNGTLIDNICSNNNQGIYLINCEGNFLKENTVNTNQYNGIYLDTTCEGNNLTKNTVNNNLFGIQLVTNCDYNNISFNTVNNNEDYGIFINSFGGTCDNNMILNNTAEQNIRHGIYLQYNNNNNSIINNTINDNLGTGMRLQSSNDVIVHSNIINNNERGITLQDCNNGNFTHNSINRNLEIGMYLSSNSDGNRIKNNTINQNDLGIGLDQSDSNNITGNTLIDNNWCILEIDSEGNLIENNFCTAPTVNTPIFINGEATGVGAHNWTWAEQQSWFGGGSGTEQFPYIIENLKISGFGITTLNGIEVINSNVYFIIQECEIYNSRGGIFLQRVNNSLIIDNNCSRNSRYGIYLEDECNYNEITANTCNDR